jgi:hypothetical protein
MTWLSDWDRSPIVVRRISGANRTVRAALVFPPPGGPKSGVATLGKPFLDVESALNWD